MTALERANLYYAANRDAVLEKRKAEYRANPDKFKVKTSAYVAANSQEVSARRHAFYTANKTRLLDWHANYRKTNQDVIKARKQKYAAENKHKIALTNLRYRTANRKQLADKRAAKLKANPSFKAACRIRSMLCRAVERGGGKKATRATDLLGCSVPFFMNFIASKFVPGMSWDNHGQWHFDHVKPLVKFGDMTILENQKLANHYTNFQPLWALENLSKGDKT